MVSAGGEKLKEEIYKLCKQVWQEGRVPKEWTEYLADEQAGFRKDRSTTDPNVKAYSREGKRKTKPIYNCFVDFQKAFDSIKQDIIWATLRSYGIGKRLTQILQDIGERSKAAIKIGKDLGEWFTT